MKKLFFLPGTLSRLAGLYVPLFLLGIWLFALPSEVKAQGTCEGGVVMGESRPVITKDNCEDGYEPSARTVTRWNPLPRAVVECECAPESTIETPQKRLCAKEFSTCTTDAECIAGGEGCEQHRCVDIDPQVIGPKPPNTKRCLAQDSPYGKQYPKAFEMQLGECKAVDTALGTIPVCDLNAFGSWILRWAIGIGGGVAFLLILWSGFQIMTSAGNPERLKAGREQLTAAIGGLLFLIFSVFLLRLIGVDILQLPGFGG